MRSKEKLNILLAEDSNDIEHTKTLLKEYVASWYGYGGIVHKNEVERANKQIENIQKSFGPPDGRLYLAKYNDKAAGCVAMIKLDDSVCEMKRLYVKPEFRGLKIGKNLSLNLVKEAKQIGYEKMRIHMVLVFKEAVQLYKSMGFYEIQSYEKTPREDSIFMELKL